MPSKARNIPVLDPPVGPASDLRAIHEWLNELDALRQQHEGNRPALQAIEREVGRALGWLHGRGDLSGAGE